MREEDDSAEFKLKTPISSQRKKSNDLNSERQKEQQDPVQKFTIKLNLNHKTDSIQRSYENLEIKQEEIDESQKIVNKLNEEVRQMMLKLKEKRLLKEKETIQ